MKYERRARRLEHPHIVVDRMRVAALAGRAYDGDPAATAEIERLAPSPRAFAIMMLNILRATEDPFSEDPS